MKILKFGGTSLGNAQRIKAVANIVVSKGNCVVVCSAMSGVTNALEDIALAWKNNNTDSAAAKLTTIQQGFEKTCYDLFDTHELAAEVLSGLSIHFENAVKEFVKPYSENGRRGLLSLGELVTSQMFSFYLSVNKVNVKLVDALSIMYLNDQDEPDTEDIAERIKKQGIIKETGIYVTQGYICRDRDGVISNLKRGGSDYTATLLGAAIRASVIEIWTDIDGLHNNDPRIVQGTFPISELSFTEAAELAYFGAKILHPACVWPAQKYNIPILLKNTMAPEAPGTIIRSGPSSGGLKAVAAKDGITSIRIISGRMFNAYGFLKKVFEVFDSFRVPVDVVTTSEVSVSITVDDTATLKPLVAELEKLGQVTVQENQCIICIVGDVLHQGLVADIIQHTREFDIRMISLGASSNNITLVLPQSQKSEALVALNSIFTNSLNIGSCLKTGS